MFAPLIAWIGTLVTAVVGWVASMIGKKLAITLAAVAVWLSIVAAFTLAVTGIINSIVPTMPAGAHITAGLSLIPSNATACIGAILATHGAAWLYETQHKILNIKLKA